IHQHGLQRLEEISSGISDAIVTLPGGHQFGAQRGDQFFKARKLFALQMQSLEFGKQSPAHLRRQLRPVLCELVPRTGRLRHPMATSSSCTFAVRWSFSPVTEYLEKVNFRRTYNCHFDRPRAMQPRAERAAQLGAGLPIL